MSPVGLGSDGGQAAKAVGAVVETRVKVHCPLQDGSLCITAGSSVNTPSRLVIQHKPTNSK